MTRVAGHARVQCEWAPSGPGTFGVSPTVHGTWLRLALVIHDHVPKLEEALGLERFGEKTAKFSCVRTKGTTNSMFSTHSRTKK